MLVCDLDKRNGGGRGGDSGATDVVFISIPCLVFDGDSVASGDLFSVEADALPTVVQDGSMASRFPSKVLACL